MFENQGNKSGFGYAADRYNCFSIYLYSGIKLRDRVKDVEQNQSDPPPESRRH